MKIKYILFFSAIAAFLGACGDYSPNNNVIAQNDMFTVTGDSVIQGDFVAYAPSPTEIVTNYHSPADSAFSPIVEFRLSLNSRDNELRPGSSHYATVGTDTVLRLGVPDAFPAHATRKPLPAGSRWTLRVNVAPMLHAFRKNGYFVTSTGDSIFSTEFKGIWVAGSAAPLTWDFDNLYSKPQFKLHPTSGDSIYALSLRLNPKKPKAKEIKSWKIDVPNPDYPTYTSKQTLIDALYNMSIDNIVRDIRHDDTFRAGAEWDGVWTRDVSYSTYLALAYLDPVRAMKSLRAKVKDGRIVQDTGTGGSWPVSSDRIVWASAAWEIYTVTGNKHWLRYAFNVIRNTITVDREVVMDRFKGLMHGEQSYLDWREQSYPRWMQPKDIYESMCLGTNVVFAHAYSILSDMCDELDINNTYEDMATHLKDAINQNLWQEDKGFYSEYLYGGIYPVLSPGIDNLGQALSIIWNIAEDDRAETLMQRTPITDFGVPSIFPRIKGIKPYHNDAVWPFVQAFWNIAAARTGNENALRHGLGSLYRAAALFATNKELLVASTGDFRGTAINSDRQLWSAAGNVAMIFRIYAGMQFLPSGIKFEPFVPGCLKGKKNISGFRYRNSVLDISISGTGNEIAKMTLDGKPCDDNFVSAHISGHHSIAIEMQQGRSASNRITVSPIFDMPVTPIIEWHGKEAYILNYVKDVDYAVLFNADKDRTTGDSIFALADLASFSNFTKIYVIPRDGKYQGFMAKPHEIIPPESLSLLQCENFAEAGTALLPSDRARRFVELSTSRNTDITIPLIVKSAGTYFIDVRYANGSGPVNTDNKCAIRSLIVNTHPQGTLVMPQRGQGEWFNTGFSNMVQVELLSGKNIIQIKYLTPQNINMNGKVNTALIDFVRVIKK